MEWFTPFGLVFITVIMIPNIVFAIRCKDGFTNNYRNKTVELVEQIGRYGCFSFMVFNVPGTWFGWASNEVFALYLILDALLVALYCILWIVCWKINGMVKALALSVIPSVDFLISGIMSRSVLLTVATLLFAPAHIFISSQHLCEKLGMRREGLFREFVSFVNDADGNPIYENTYQYAILKKEWYLQGGNT